jgi:arylformamidase
MPYILSPPITENLEGMWFEGPAYEKETIYSLKEGKVPPVNYDKHILKSHSLTHIEGSKHVDNAGKTVDEYFSGNYFYGDCTVIKLRGNNYQKLDKGIHHWEVSKEELQTAIGSKKINKLLLTTENYPVNKNGFHDPHFVLTLSIEAASWLIENHNISLYGTSWKSSDFKPGSLDRPIHKKLFEKAVILECLDLKDVPEGNYFLMAYPLRINGSSESPVTPVLFEYGELLAPK